LSTPIARYLQNLDEQSLDLLEKPSPERGDRVVIRMLVRRDEAEGHRVIPMLQNRNSWNEVDSAQTQVVIL
jgi:hypothetical protein